MVGSTDLDTRPAVNVPAGTDGISWAEEKEKAPPSSLTSPVDLGALNKMDVLGSRIGRNCTADPLKCHRRRRLLAMAAPMPTRVETPAISIDPRLILSESKRARPALSRCPFERILSPFPLPTLSLLRFSKFRKRCGKFGLLFTHNRGVVRYRKSVTQTRGRSSEVETIAEKSKLKEG